MIELAIYLLGGVVATGIIAEIQHREALQRLRSVAEYRARQLGARPPPDW